MPKNRRSSEEIDAVKENIMMHALELIILEGYDGFSMRKLGARLNIAAKTIYNYFHSQDDLYLHLLIKGFKQLLESFESSIEPYNDPMDQLHATIRAYVDFGIEHANIYNILFTLHVPKYNDYLGTPMEDAAHAELQTALKCQHFFMDRIAACVGDSIKREEDIRFEVVHIWTQMHGYVSGINNTLLDYMYENPICIKEKIIKRIFQTTQNEIIALKKQS